MHTKILLEILKDDKFCETDVNIKICHKYSEKLRAEFFSAIQGATSGIL